MHIVKRKKKISTLHIECVSQTSVQNTVASLITDQIIKLDITIYKTIISGIFCDETTSKNKLIRIAKDHRRQSPFSKRFEGANPLAKIIFINFKYIITYNICPVALFSSPSSICPWPSIQLCTRI